MENDELVALQARKIAELEKEIAVYRDNARQISILLCKVGGPLNDNILKYSPEQLTIFFKIEELVS